MKNLRLVTPDEMPPARNEPARAFTFRRRRGGCEVGLKNADRSWSLLTLATLPTNIAAARLWARTYAVRHCFPYAEVPFRDPDPTPEEIRRARANAEARSARWRDEEAQSFWEDERFREAAQELIRSAHAIEEFATFQPGSEDQWGRAAANRVDLAIQALGRYRARLLATRRGSALKEPPNP